MYFLYFPLFCSLILFPPPPPSPQKTWGGKYKNSGGFPPGEFKSFPPKTPATQNEEESGVHERIQNEKSRVRSGSETESKTGMGIEPRTGIRNGNRTRRTIIIGFCTKNGGFLCISHLNLPPFLLEPHISSISISISIKYVLQSRVEEKRKNCQILHKFPYRSH